MSSGIKCRIAGFNHHKGSFEWLDKRRVGEHRVLLMPEPDNKFDKNAIKIITPEGLMLGYVPAVDAAGVLERLADRDVLVRAFKVPRHWNACDIHYITEDPLA
jgi:hypothetical protein